MDDVNNYFNYDIHACLGFRQNHITECQESVKTMNYFLLLVMAVLARESQACCFPEKFSFGFSSHLGAKITGRQNMQVNATLTGRMYMNGEKTDVFTGGNGVVTIVMGGGQEIAVPYSISMGMEGGKNFWIKVRSNVPGSARIIEKCSYIEIIGDIPDGYRCVLNAATEVGSMDNGGTMYQKSIPPFITDTIAVDDNCIPTAEVLDIDVNKILAASQQMSGGNKRAIPNVQLDIAMVTSDRQTTVSESVADHKKPANCILSNRVKLPKVSEGGPDALLRNQLLQSYTGARKRRSVSRKRAVDQVKEELSRMARDTINDMTDYMSGLFGQ